MDSGIRTRFPDFFLYKKRGSDQPLFVWEITGAMLEGPPEGRQGRHGPLARAARGRHGPPAALEAPPTLTGEREEGECADHARSEWMYAAADRAPGRWEAYNIAYIKHLIVLIQLWKMDNLPVDPRQFPVGELSTSGAPRNIPRQTPDHFPGRPRTIYPDARTIFRWTPGNIPMDPGPFPGGIRIRFPLHPSPFSGGQWMIPRVHPGPFSGAPRTIPRRMADHSF
eukprot:gene15781-biopygen7116